MTVKAIEDYFPRVQRENILQPREKAYPIKQRQTAMNEYYPTIKRREDSVLHVTRSRGKRVLEGDKEGQQ
jgi:hypothetical protein